MDTSVTDLLTESGFVAGLAFGGIVAVVFAFRAVVDHRRHLQIGGAFAAAVVAGFAQQSILATSLLLGMIALAASAVPAAGHGSATQVIATLPGAVLVAISTGLGIASWATVTVVVVILVGGPLLANFDRSLASTGVLPLLLTVTMAGVWATVPETAHATVPVGVSVPVTLLGWPFYRAWVGAGGATLIVALIGWAVVADGAVRPGSVVGGLACLGILILEPVVRHSGPRLRDWRVTALVLLHVMVVGVSSRVAGLRATAAAALTIAAVIYTVSAAVIVALTVQQNQYQEERS